jgi:hypothetical protein
VTIYLKTTQIPLPLPHILKNMVAGSKEITDVNGIPWFTVTKDTTSCSTTR